MKKRLTDRRNRPRFEIVGDLWGTLETVVGMSVRDIAPGGALLESAIPLQPESVHRVTVSYEGQLTPVSVRIRHVRGERTPDGLERYLVGVEFMTSSPLLQASIASWMVDDGTAAGTAPRVDGTE